MSIFNLGSINIDHVYQVNGFPNIGETVASFGYEIGLGGKGANQSVAAAYAGAKVNHIGAIGAGDDWIIELVNAKGVSTSNVKISQTPTGHAVICVDQNAENTIVIFNGANCALDLMDIRQGLMEAKFGDWLLLQNETNLGFEAVKFSKERGLKIAYSAAPFDCKVVQKILPFCDLIVMNELEAQQCEENILQFEKIINDKTLIVTKGAVGVDCHYHGEKFSVPAFSVVPIDTTGAGDTFFGFLLAELDKGSNLKEAIKIALAAAAIQITEKGAIGAIPHRKVVDAFLEDNK